MIKHDVKDIALAKKGKLRIEWAAQEMPVLKSIAERFKRERPLKGVKIAACLHVTTETANLMETLKTGGAEVALWASNTLSTQDDVAASLVKNSGIPVFAIKGEDSKTYYKHINSALSVKPHMTMYDGADLVSTLHTKQKALLSGIQGGTEETTTGVIRLRAMAEKGVDGSLAAIEREAGKLPPTVEARTGGGGRHLYFAHPGGHVGNRAGILPGIDLRGDGGVIVLPASIHPCGNAYAWVPGHSPDDLPLRRCRPASSEEKGSGYLAQNLCKVT